VYLYGRKCNYFYGINNVKPQNFEFTAVKSVKFGQNGKKVFRKAVKVLKVGRKAMMVGKRQ
jgi:hypothetical protein